MIRHIPNKYSIKLLINELNVNYKDKYDFIYLPIDNNNHCNLGFGFINFTHFFYILEFYDEYFGRKWKKFNSEKICELVYAKIQGKKNLYNHVINNDNIRNDKNIPIYYMLNNEDNINNEDNNNDNDNNNNINNDNNNNNDKNNNNKINNNNNVNNKINSNINILSSQNIILPIKFLKPLHNFYPYIKYFIDDIGNKFKIIDL